MRAHEVAQRLAQPLGLLCLVVHAALPPQGRPGDGRDERRGQSVGARDPEPHEPPGRELLEASQGCRSLAQIEILPRPPVERAPDNPWPEWPRVYKLDYGQEEAAARFGADPRVYVATVKRFVGDAAGRLESVVTVDVHWRRDAEGRLHPVEIEGSERTRPAEIALIAMRSGLINP